MQARKLTHILSPPMAHKVRDQAQIKFASLMIRSTYLTMQSLFFPEKSLTVFTNAAWYSDAWIILSLTQKFPQIQKKPKNLNLTTKHPANQKKQKTPH